VKDQAAELLLASDSRRAIELNQLGGQIGNYQCSLEIFDRP
jgi:hypothetical protein